MTQPPPSDGLPPPPAGHEGGDGFPPPPRAGQQARTGGQQAGGGGEQAFGAPSPERNGVAVASMVSGIVSLVCLLLFFLLITVPIAIVAAIAAIITGVLGLRASRRGDVGGRGQAIAGLVTGTISLALVAVVTVAALAAWNYIGFETSPVTDPEGFLRELEERGIDVDEEGNVDLEDLRQELEEEDV